MNAHSLNFHLTVELRQLRESLLCFMHTVLLHRCFGKFTPNETLTSLGLSEIPCENLDVNYVRVNSPELVKQLESRIQPFLEEITVAAGDIATVAETSRIRQGIFSPDKEVISSHVKIEFFTKKKRSQWQQWISKSDEAAVWEIWELHLDIVKVRDIEDLNHLREKVSEDLSDLMLRICCSMNRGQYTPKTVQNNENYSIHDESISDCQPYHYRILWNDRFNGVNRSNTGSFVSNILKDTFIF